MAPLWLCIIALVIAALALVCAASALIMAQWGRRDSQSDTRQMVERINAAIRDGARVRMAGK